MILTGGMTFDHLCFVIEHYLLAEANKTEPRVTHKQLKYCSRKKRKGKERK